MKSTFSTSIINNLNFSTLQSLLAVTPEALKSAVSVTFQVFDYDCGSEVSEGGVWLRS